MALLAVGAGAAAWLAVKSEERAARNFELTIDQADALVTKTSTELKDRIGISQDVIRRMLGLIESQMDALTKVDERSPRLAASRANMLSAFVDNYIDLGDLAEARQRAEQCVDVARPLQRADDKSLGTVRVLAGCLEKLASALAARSLFNDAIAAYRESLELRRRVLAADPGNPVLRVELCHELTYFAFALLVADKVDEALAFAQEGLSLIKPLVSDSRNASWRREYVDSLNIYAMILDEKGGTHNAIENYQTAIETVRDLINDDRGNATLRRFLSNILANLSDTLFKHSFNNEALNALRQSIAVKRYLTGADPGNATWNYELATSLSKLGRTQLAMESLDDAFLSFEEARGRFQEMVDRDPQNALRRYSLADTLLAIVRIKVKQNDDAAARTHAQQGLAVLQAVDIDAASGELSRMMKDVRQVLSDFLGVPQTK
jgi:tetratricopeptide (TPR) repeat protein